MLYSAQSPELCALELHSHVPPSFPPLEYWLQIIEVPEVEISELDPGLLSEKWINNRHETQQIGDHFIDENKYLILKVPSAWIYHCYNYLINPSHKDFIQVRLIDKIPFPLKGKLFDR